MRVDALEVDHSRCDVAVSHPLLQGPDVDAVLEVSRSVRVAEFVQEPTATVGSFGTAIDRGVQRNRWQRVDDSGLQADQYCSEVPDNSAADENIVLAALARVHIQFRHT